jgi:hypothetical protein
MFRNQAGQSGTQVRLPLTPAITSMHMRTAQILGSRVTACAAIGSRISGRSPPGAMLLIFMPIPNSISR